MAENQLLATKKLFCLRAGVAVQLSISPDYRRLTKDLDVYAFCKPEIFEQFLSRYIEARKLHGDIFTVDSRDFVHESLSPPIREYQVKQAGVGEVLVQVVYSSVLPETAVAPFLKGTSLEVLARSELVAEKLLKFSSHSVHRHDSRLLGSRAKHLSDLFFLLEQASPPSAVACRKACLRVLERERLIEGWAPDVENLLVDVTGTLQSFLNDLPAPEPQWKSYFPPGPNELSLPGFLAFAASYSLNWVKHLRREEHN